ncbi:hypothetical protein CCHR01_09787 [Colletotrichum chrysophilum]|uniref:Uncharacterized protein n=1 Tax=Colletotrichum chrysophilum TaxID=1836956 RepID=A0AAD9EDU5_9PEZI|nr:hypothetical protein CCHR01_09787 [Colletotrichum chrysophilum]
MLQRPLLHAESIYRRRFGLLDALSQTVHQMIDELS